MFVVNEDNSIYATRGDIVFFSVTAEDKGNKYTFKAGDVLRIKVYGKKNAEDVVLQKDFPVTEDTELVEIFLTEEDTKIGDVISKPKDYWYEVELNPYNNPQTIIGYDEDGARVFKLFPEGDDIPEYVPSPEDFAVMDDELDMTSTRPVENQAVARAMVSLNALAEETAAGLAIEKARFDNLISEDDSEVSQNLEYLDYITENTRAKIDASVNSDGVFGTVKVNLREANLFYGGTNMDVFIIPKECRPIDTGLIHTEDGLEYRINYDNANNRYVLNLKAQDDVTVAPSGAGTVTMTYKLGDYELKDIRVGADGKIYPTAGEAVRAQFETMKAASAFVTPQMYGAVGDGVTDDTAAFQAAQESDNPVYVPLGSYVVNDFTFSKAKEWAFQRSNSDPWFNNGTTILTSTGITISGGVKISNMVVEYNGAESVENRPAGIRMQSHFCELHGIHVSHFYVGMDFGEGAGGHSDYTRIYDLYAWYNYLCGVRMMGVDDAQISFVSFYDVNVNSNGVDVHDRSVAPDTSRGYGFLIGTVSSLYINNGDFSSNETAGIYIDNATPANNLRGMMVDTVYAEHNKFCNIYYNNADPSGCRTRFVDIRNAYFYNDANDIYFTQDVYMVHQFVPPTVTLAETRGNPSLPDCYSPSIDMARAKERKVNFRGFYGLSGNSYKVILTVMPQSSGNVTFQHIPKTYRYINRSYVEEKASVPEEQKIPIFNVGLEEGVQKTFTFYVTLPDIDGQPLFYDTASYGAAYYLIDGKVENVTVVDVTDSVFGVIPSGTTRMNGDVFQVYNGKAWKNVQLT